jgi:glyoxylase-like metal-dependent hydrolase (beta-lactamase superfamily II)
MIKLTPTVSMVAGGSAGLSAPTDANCYLISHGDSAVLIDAGSGINTERILQNIKEVGVDPSTISVVLNTHSHWDHARGDNDMNRLLGCPVGMYSTGHSVLTDERWSNHLGTKTGFEPPPAVDSVTAIKDGQVYEIGDVRLTAVYTPGHTADSMSFLLDEDGNRILFTGDMVQGDAALGAVWFDSDLVGYRNSLARMQETRPNSIMPGHKMFTLANGDAWLAHAVKTMTATWHGFVTDGPSFAPSWWLANYKGEVVNRP